MRQIVDILIDDLKAYALIYTAVQIKGVAFLMPPACL